jgi:hypothetical protein
MPVAPIPSSACCSPRHPAPATPLNKPQANSPELENLGLQPSLQEILSLEGQDVIETHTLVVQHTDTDQTTDEGVSLEESLGVLVVELEELTSGTTDLGVSVCIVGRALLGGSDR